VTRPSVPAGFSLRLFDEIDSTNEEARRLAKSGEQGPVWILAKRQTAGRGRRGRDWVSPVGNLMATLFFRPQVTAAQGGQLSFVAALAVADTIAALAPNTSLSFKWPNDVFLKEQKVAGILLESASQPGTPQLDWLAVGIGVNLAHFPTELPAGAWKATSLAEAGHPGITPEAAIIELAKAWSRRFGEWQKHGFAAVRQHWLLKARGLGAAIRVRLPSETFEGIFAGLDDSGALELRLPSGLTRTIAAGEVFFPTEP
jgi:BirA family transcriptional regulator, biotin operon repressor / biotin---[acetyl-CoA-carboxylase] ligase